ncbi:MAG TPA: hypothetical protein VLK84_06490, partial [Longimicrobium sp.]|nr:hypothetical protein [Longimicrobium sp.]
MILNTSPVKRIYWVPGNNDVARESARPAALGRTDEFNLLVSQRLHGVTLQSLTACYTGAGVCSVDVPNTRYTLLGVPTVSFKNKATQPTDTVGNRALQDSILVQATAFVSAEASRGRRVLVATHIPEIDDPYVRGQQLFAGAAPGRTTLGASAWNVTDSAFAAWKRLVESPGVARVLAGHFHDSHREVYDPPYAWAESSTLRADPTKLLLAPPLSVKNQEASPIQARGFSLVRLYADSVDRRMFWMDAAGHFVEARRATAAASRGDDGEMGENGEKSWFVPGWLWRVGNGVGNPGQTAILWLGILVALLTVAALDFPDPPRTDGQTPTQTGGAASPAFAGNLGRTVAGGLSGIAGVALLQDVLGTGGNGGKAFFLTVFIFFFLVFLVGSALARGALEAFRSRVASDYHVPPVTGVRYPMVRRFFLWLGSLRTALLVFVDTALNVLFGRGSQQVVVWETRFNSMQASLLHTIDLVREDMSRAVGAALHRHGYPDAQPGTDYRVNVSLLAASGLETFYISTEPGSLDRVFGSHSMAYVAVRAGEARWWKEVYMPGPPRLRSTSRLRLRGSGDIPGATPLTGLQVIGPRPVAPTPVAAGTVSVSGTRADAAAVNQQNVAVNTVDELLALLNNASGFGGTTPVVEWRLDADGVLEARAGGDAPNLAVASLQLGGIELGPFVGGPAQVVLFDNDPVIFEGAGSPMLLEHF